MFSHTVSTCKYQLGPSVTSRKVESFCLLVVLNCMLNGFSACVQQKLSVHEAIPAHTVHSGSNKSPNKLSKGDASFLKQKLPMRSLCDNVGFCSNWFQHIKLNVHKTGCLEDLSMMNDVK